MEDLELLDLDDLSLDELSITSMRDVVELPETAASCSCSCCDNCGGNCSCCHTE
jgi:hypothetical protein